jgi:ADP-heptose:LPS heptosyltransferase
MSRALTLDAFDSLARCWGRLKATKTKPSGLLLVRSGGIGDLILFSHVFPRFRALAEPGEPITLMLRRDAAKAAFLLGPGVEILTVDYGKFLSNPGYRWSVSTDLRRRNFRKVVTTDERRHPLIDEALIAATGAPERVGLDAMAWPKYDRRLARNRRFFTKLHSLPAKPLHVVEKWAELADLLTGKTEEIAPLRLPDSLLTAPERLERPVVVIQPFAAVPEKQITAGDVGRILDALPEGTDAVITGAPRDLERAPEIAALLSRPHVRFDGRTFVEIVPLLRAATLVVSVDTALMHLAAAVGAPTLGLASAAWVGEIVPYPAHLTPPNLEILYHDMPCAGCRAACLYPPEQGMYPCVARLDRQLMLAKVRAAVTVSRHG